jgi:MFS family permease
MVAAVLVFLSMLSSTLLIPALRPFFAATHPTAEGGLFLFMSVNMLGAIVGAPLLTAVADATGKRSLVLMLAAVVDGALLFLCSLPMDLGVVLALRTIQGAANVAAVSLLMGLTTSRGVPVAGGATIAAIAVGAPLGTLLLPLGPQMPLQVGAMLPIVVAIAVGALQPGRAPDAQPRRRLRLAEVTRALPAGLFVFAERLAIGLFIVPFSLLCHDVRGFDDAVVGRLFAAFLVPFAVGTALWPRLGIQPVVAVVGGGIAYAASLVAAARVDAMWPLVLVLVVGGIGAAGVYGPSLRSVARLVPAGRVGAAMGVVNALGALGMLLGSGGAGALTRAGAAAGASRADSLTRSFDVAAVCLLVLVAVGAPLLRRALLAANHDADGGDDDDGADADHAESAA